MTTKKTPKPTDFNEEDSLQSLLNQNGYDDNENSADLDAKTNQAPATRQDLQDMASYLKQTMAVNVSDSVKAALQEAYSAGYQQHDTDLDQRVTGLQNRMNSLAANSSQATRQASADHSKLEQLNQVWQQMFNAFSDNTKLLDDALHQMQMPIEISAKEAVQAIQSTSGKSVRKMISAEVVQWLRGTRQAVADDADTIKDAKKELSNELHFAGKWLEVVLGGVVLAMIVPNATLKVLCGALGIIGGWAYAKFKS